MEVIRAFIAFSLSEEIYQQLEMVTKNLQSRLPGVPVRWVPAHNIHLTIKFLGNVSPTNLEVIKTILKAEANRQPAFEISVGGLGAFPTVRRPQVLWVGVEAPNTLQQIQSEIEEETSRLGYAPENRPFSPHLTLARTSRNAAPEDIRKVSEAISGYKVGFLGAMKINDIHLYRSDLQRGGSVYTRLFSVGLQ